VASIAARGTSTVTSLVAVPLTLRYLGTERYGLWITISSFVALLGFADLGLGNGLLTILAASHGKEDREEARRDISSAFFLLLAIGVGLLVGFAVAARFVPWARIYNVESDIASRECLGATAALAACFAASLPLGVVQRVQHGYQEGFAVHLWQAGGNVLGLALLLVAIRSEAGLPWLVLALTGSPLVATLISWAPELLIKRPWLLPSWSLVSRASARRVLGIGALFFLLQVSIAFYASDNFVIAHVLGQDAVVVYSVPARLFAAIGLVASTLFAPLWPAYGEALARGDLAWARRTLVRSLELTFVVCAVPAVTLALWGHEILALWVGRDLEVPSSLLVGLAVWTVLAGLGNALAMFLNGAAELRMQVVCALSTAVVSLGLRLLLARPLGVSGIAWGIVAAYLVFAALPLAWHTRTILTRLAAASVRPNTPSSGERQAAR
jgi:O-antigen/teichoic acid export membrane protein